MEKPNYTNLPSLENHSVFEVISLIGDRWTLCIISEAFYGTRRFADMRDNLGIASNILTNRLARLVEHGVFEQLPYKESGRRTRYEYQLTHKGLDLLPTLVSLLVWGDRYMPSPAVASAKLIRSECNHEVHLEILCEDGHKVTKLSELKRIVQRLDEYGIAGSS